jgi:hypothetical protein
MESAGILLFEVSTPRGTDAVLMKHCLLKEDTHPDSTSEETRCA